jgi:hypothetical protein
MEIEYLWFNGPEEAREQQSFYRSFEFEVMNTLDAWMYWYGLDEEQRIHPTPEGEPLVSVNSLETSFIRVGMGQSEDERLNDVFWGPYDVHMWLDDIELDVHQFQFLDLYGYFWDETIDWTIFYVIFDPETLVAGTHNIDIEWSWFNGSGENQEQIIVYSTTVFEVI